MGRITWCCSRKYEGDHIVFGLFEDRIEIQVEKPQYAIGDVLRGTLKLKLSKPREAKRLSVSIYRRITDPAGQSWRMEFEGEKELSQRKIYHPGEEFEFSMRIPQPETVFLSDSHLHELYSKSLRFWFLEARLDTFLIFGTTNRVNLNVMELPGTAAVP